MTFHKYLGDSKMFEYDKHYQECRQQNKPFIKAKINPVHGNYYINVDLMPCRYTFSKEDQTEIEKLIQSSSLSIHEVTQKPITVKPKPPFMTSTLI